MRACRSCLAGQQSLLYTIISLTGAVVEHHLTTYMEGSAKGLESAVAVRSCVILASQAEPGHRRGDAGTDTARQVRTRHLLLFARDVVDLPVRTKLASCESARMTVFLPRGVDQWQGISGLLRGNP
jgi:hypothetical protein